MSTRNLLLLHTAAKNVYFSLTNQSGQFFDFADNTFKALGPHAINAVTTGIAGAGAFRVATDVTALLTVGKKIRVRGSTGNDGVYTIRAGSAFGGGNTTINVDEAVVDATVDGTVDLNATPYVAATERTDLGGTGKSGYVGSIDMSLVNTTSAVGEHAVTAYERAGSFPIPGTDTVVSLPDPLPIQFAEFGEGQLDVEFDGAFTTTAGTTVRFLVALLRNGVRVPLETYAPTATCALAVREHGAGGDLFTIAATTVNAAGVFELEKATPGYTADREYKYTLTIVENANTLTFTKCLPVHG